jgi:DNA-binding PadR family transcriptional regulator
VPLPDLTSLQFLVLHVLMGGQRAGRQIRDVLAEHGVSKTGPAFYQLMDRMEKAKFVTGSYETKVIDGQTIKERHYEATNQGVRAYNETHAFYVAAQASKGGLLGGLALA